MTPKYQTQDTITSPGHQNWALTEIKLNYFVDCTNISYKKGPFHKFVCDSSPSKRNPCVQDETNAQGDPARVQSTRCSVQFVYFDLSRPQRHQLTPNVN